MRSETFTAVRGRRTFPASAMDGSPSAPGDGERRPPGVGQDQLARIGVRGPHAGDEGHAGAEVAERRRHVPRLPDSRSGGISTWRSRGRISPVRSSSRRERSWRRIRKLDGHDPARARVDALPEDLHRELAADQASERRRRPELVVVAAGRVEAHHEARRPDASLQRVHVGGEVGAPALLAGLDEDDAPGVRHPLGLERLHGGEGGERRVPVVGRAPPVEPVAAADRRPRPQPLAPAHHLGLLVEMPVEEHRSVGRSPGISIRSTGVRPGSRTTSTWRPSTGRWRAQLAASSTARSR